ncbi:MAG: molybdopterin cofactor-binding domain-containing protein, partial [Pseudomonadota bacterium]
MIKPTRRTFLVAGAATGAGLAGAAIFGVGVLAGVDTDGLAPVLRDDGAVGLNAWIEIHPDGRIVLAAPRVEMGQGAQTGLAMLMAEELEVSPSATNVEVRHPVETLPAYANFALGLGARPEEASGPVHWASEKVFGLLPMIVTGGSTSIVDGFVSMRIAGASAREMLRGAAAELWGAPLDTCAAEDGFIVERGSNRRAAYGELAEAASRRRPPTNPSLKPPRDWRLIGTDQVRMDADDKARGASVFGVDVALDGMLYAATRHADVMGARVLSFDPAPARAAPGVVEVVDLGDAVAVIADSYHRAQQGLDALSIQFGGGDDALSTEEVSETLRAALTDKPGHTFAAEGDIRDALKGDEETGASLDAVYETPFLPHLCMEPMNATA